MKKTILLVSILIISCVNLYSDVRGKVLLLDAPGRGKSGDLLLCTINGKKKKIEILVKGSVVDARFSPDGKEIVYGLNKKIKIFNLKTKISRDIGSFEATHTYFNWGLGNKIYWSDGPDKRQIFRINIKTKKKKMIHKGNKGRSTMSLDGKVAAWVIPPVCSVIGGKTYRYMGGCGGAVSPSGKLLTSNLTTSHKIMGIFTMGKNGPSEKPFATVTAPSNFAFNGFFFGRSDDWVCYTIEHPKKVSPTSFICYWRTNEHIQISEFGKYCIYDYFDESNVLPVDATLKKISICSLGPLNNVIGHTTTNVGLTKHLKVVGHFTGKGGTYTPELKDGITWKVDTSKLILNGSTYKGVSKAKKVKITAEYKGKSASFQVTILPELTGDGFKAELFGDATFTKKVLVRKDPIIDFRWTGRQSPDKAINGRAAWAVQWTGKLNVQTGGEYTFYFLQGEGNDRGGYEVYINGEVKISNKLKGSNLPGRWSKPKASDPILLKKGMHSIKVRVIDNKKSHAVVAKLYWSGPGIKQSLLGKPYIHSK
ncbi:MAG: hypothetical protein COA79_26220 [Planctomycetota bacterium]|nr:MAG: hypothetical protein COA79_26220 [Planctomycetota bacterium]